MEKIAINPNRLMWCCRTLGIDVSDVYSEIGIVGTTFARVMEGKAVLSINQLEKIAKYFNRSLLFFLESSDVVEEKIYSPQFRTINNQKPIHSRKLRKFIDSVEEQRKIYLSLLKGLNTPIPQNWQEDLNLSTDNIKQSSRIVRQWLGLKIRDKFNDFRGAVEDKGIMVIVSNGYNGKWKIGKQDPTRGFCLNYDILPIIVIKKQSEGANAFTLMHELAHLLLHKTSVLDNAPDFYSYHGREKEAHTFSSSVLIPDEFLAQINLDELVNIEIGEHDNYLKSFKDDWCVSGDAILYRLLIENKITKAHYNDYKTFKAQQDAERKKALGDAPTIPRSYRHREPLNMFGRSFVATVLDARQNKHITLSKASTYLDNLKIHTLHKLERELVQSRHGYELI